MIDYGMLILESCVEEISIGASAGIGAAAGAGISTAVWAKKRLSLNKKLKACIDNECRTKVKSQIKLLRNNSLKYGALATLGGAGTGVAAKGILRGNKLATKSKDLTRYGANKLNMWQNRLGHKDWSRHQPLVHKNIKQAGNMFKRSSSLASKSKISNKIGKIGTITAVGSAGLAIQKMSNDRIKKELDKKKNK